ncbi:hypothetical protein BEWA_037210 [Theileria equi strain WA]|uniref:Uncharacterized protein n=1 Tax=Theileria equi strain WA TaxID=1537102 RepID=L1LEK4_THEEQ|nr:hypothetical protein BEWA_037210 [Theileria equi strain WA]EKX73685.1 hypothetical protein BEWA_037210 [Theileria equi strain WA]|eukprot:XP_004833137.1 hypothetical protein BEWA_037210 [Theileria equi strain WA]
MTPGNTLKLEVNRQCGKDGTCNCNERPTGIEAKKEDSIENVTGFVALTHDRKGIPFILKKRIDGNERLESDKPIEDVTKVSVYYWDEDTSYDKPLLMEVIKSGGPQNVEYYYKSEDHEQSGADPNIWKQYIAGSGTPLQAILDDRNCVVHNVIPLVLETPEQGIGIETNCTKSKKVEAVGGGVQLTGSEYMVTEYKSSGSGTGISRVEYGKKKISGVKIPSGALDKIRFYSSTSVDGDMPIMFNLNLKNGEKRWFYNQSTGGTKWQETGGNRFYTIDGKPTENLAKQLDGFACKYHKAVTMDLTKGASEKKEKDCSNGKSQNISVTTGEIMRDGGRNMKYTKYSITDPKHKLVDIKFYHNGDENQRRHVKSNSLNFPIEGPVDIYTFYSNGSTDPKLVYIHKEGKSKAYGWYRMQTNDGHNKKWLRIPRTLKSIKHNHIEEKKLNCKQWSDLAKVLKHDTAGFQNCQESVAESSQVARTDDGQELGPPEDEVDEQSGDEYDQSLAQEGNPTSEDNSEDKKEKLEPDASGSHSKADGKTRSIPNVGKEADQEPLEPPGTLPKTPLSAEKTPVKKKVSESKESPLPHELISGETGRSEDFRRWQRNQMGENPLLDPYYEDLMKKKKKEKEEQEQLQKQEELQKKTEKEGGLGSAESASTAQTEAKVIPGSNLQAEGARSAGEKVESSDGNTWTEVTASQSSSGAPPGGSQFKTPDGALLTVVDTFKQIAFASLSLTESGPGLGEDAGKEASKE